MYFWASDRTIGYFLNKGAHLSIFLFATLSKLFYFKLEFFKNKFSVVFIQCGSIVFF